uniref:Lipocalin n=1 Tax=Rhipicephalus zambeziensis TaxID=60191 RepID=A0A224YND6_9ACAR
MKYLVSLAVALTESFNVSFYLEQNATFAQYQDGWTFMSSQSRMYLTKRNFNTDPQGRNLTRCVSAQTMRVDNCTYEVEQNITYYNSTSGTWISFMKNFTASSMEENGTVRNFFNSTYKDYPLTYIVVFAGQDCLLARLPYRSNDTVRACELWVRGSYFGRSDQPITCCDFLFDYFCDPVVQILYSKENCSVFY